MKQHIHHDAIIAWAKGAQMQSLSETTGNWFDVETPLWQEKGKYRVKPTPVIQDLTFNLYINSVEQLALKFEEKGVGRVHPSYKAIGKINVTMQDKEIVNYSVDIAKGTTI